MEHAMDKYKILHVVERNEIENKMVKAVDIHRKAVELVSTKTMTKLFHNVPFFCSFVNIILLNLHDNFLHMSIRRKRAFSIYIYRKRYSNELHYIYNHKNYYYFFAFFKWSHRKKHACSNIIKMLIIYMYVYNPDVIKTFFLQIFNFRMPFKRTAVTSGLSKRIYVVLLRIKYTDCYNMFDVQDMLIFYYHLLHHFFLV